MPHAIPLMSTRRQILLLLIDNGEPEIGILALALSNGAPCSCSTNTIGILAAGATPIVVLMNDGERPLVVDDELMDDHERSSVARHQKI